MALAQKAPQETTPHADLPRRPHGTPQATWDYVSNAYAWYDRGARRSRVSYWSLKAITLTAGALVTVLAAAGFAGAAIAVPAALALLAEGLQQTGQFHANYIAYRLVAEGIYTEVWTYATDGVGTDEEPLTTEQRDRALGLTANVTSIIRAQNADWGHRMLQSRVPTQDPADDRGRGATDETPD